MPSAGTYQLKFRYDAGGTNVTAGLLVNGANRQVWSLPTTGWGNFVETTMNVTLASGTNTIRIEGNNTAMFRQDALTVTNGATGGGGGANSCSGSFEGHFDTSNCGQFAGWVWNSTLPNTPLYIDLVDGSTVIQSNIFANTFRGDLLAAGKGDGNKSFSFAPPASIKDGQAHLISIKVSGCSYSLINSPRFFQCSVGSRVASAQEEENTINNMVIFPNPTDTDLTVSLTLTESTEVKLKLVDVLGKPAKEMSFEGKEGNNTFVMDVSKMGEGTYLLKATYGDKQATQKVLIKK